MSTILVAEHDEDISSHLCDALRSSLECSVIRADQGTACLNMVESLVPDVILLCVHLPGMDGIEVCEALRRNQKSMHVPIILLASSLDAPEVITKGLEAGADDYLILPASDLELVTRVQVVRRMKQIREESSQAGELAISLSAQTAHQLRSPLNSIMGLAELIQKPFYGDLTEKQKYFVRIIADSGRQLLNLINELERDIRTKE